MNEEVAALKHELVKAEELRTRLESFNSTLEHSLNMANIDNTETKEQLDTLMQVSYLSILCVYGSCSKTAMFR